MRVVVLASLCSLSASLLPAQGWIVPRPCGIGIVPIESRALPPVRDCRPAVVRTRSDVRVELADRVLRYDIEERFVNHGPIIGEADYYFPLPANAAFQDLRLSIDGELVAGETMDAARARGVYESIVRAKRDPALVEWMGHGLLHARVFPINPGEEKRVVVRFQSVAPREGDALRIDYIRGAAEVASNPRDSSASSFTLTYRAAPELGNPFSPTHTLDVADHDGRREVTVRGDARDLTLLVPVRRSSAAAISVLPYAPGNEDGFALITVTPPAVATAGVTPRDVTLVLDVSGSMQGRKIEQARAAARQLLGTLRPQDRFRLIDFSNDVRTFRDDFTAASSGNVREATRYLDALEAQGGTNIEAALREATRPRAAAGRLPLILFVTDGEPTVGDANPDHLAALASDASTGSTERRRIFTFGLGADVNVSLLEQLALEGRGTAQFVRPDESVERMMGIVANRLVDPVMTDVRVRVEGGADVRLSKMLPVEPLDAFADRDLVVLARYSGHGTARVIVEGSRNRTPAQWTTTADFPDRERQNPFVARIWAAQRVGFLSAEKRKHGGANTSELDDEIKMLGDRYGIPTEFTSYLVTEPQFTTARLVQPRGGIAAGAPAAAPMRLEMVTTTGSLASAASPASSAAPRSAFEAAKAASVQRQASSIAVLDSMASPNRSASASRSTRRVDGRTFTWRDSAWVDARYRAGIQTLSIKPFSRAYFDLLDKLPELRPVFVLGSRVVVVGRDRAIRLDESGVSELSAAALAALVKAW